MEKYGMDSFVCFAGECSCSSYAQLIGFCNDSFEEQMKAISVCRRDKNYKELMKIRSHIYLNPPDTFDPEKIHSLYSCSSGHLRAIYKKCFGVSFHQDCIAARIARAKYYLLVTSMNISDIAEQCGYTDDKYFMRQFLAETGSTVTQYRNTFK